MAHRQDEKQRRREERLAKERADAAVAARKKRLGIVLGGVLALVVVAGAVVLIFAAGHGASSNNGGPTNASANAKIPAQQTADLGTAVKAAGCVVQNPPIEGRGHATKKFTETDYKTNPPTSGAHYPQWYDDGVYNPGDVPNLGMLVHTLEHGRIDVQYRPGTPQSTVAGLETLVGELDSGYHMLLFENTTNMPYAVAATAWGHLLGCKTMSPKVYDAIRTFRERYIDQGPERIP